MIIHKALYGLRSSGLRWHERFADTLHDMGFKISKADNDVWMHRTDDVYEYIAVYVDDLCIAAKDPSSITESFKNLYGYKLKGVGEMKFHLGCDYYRDPDGVLCSVHKGYIEKMVEGFNIMFPGEQTDKGNKITLIKNNHPDTYTRHSRHGKRFFPPPFLLLLLLPHLHHPAAALAVLGRSFLFLILIWLISLSWRHDCREIMVNEVATSNRVNQPWRGP